VRITRSARGITVDGASDGRGAWLCRSESVVDDALHDGRGPDVGPIVAADCLEAAVSRRAFARAWRGDVSVAEVRAITEMCGVAIAR
jgi:predicted RNA-binding protein YlxR (DUF448 family)